MNPVGFHPSSVIPPWQRLLGTSKALCHRVLVAVAHHAVIHNIVIFAQLRLVIVLDVLDRLIRHAVRLALGLRLAAGDGGDVLCAAAVFSCGDRHSC